MSRATGGHADAHVGLRVGRHEVTGDAPLYLSYVDSQLFGEFGIVVIDGPVQRGSAIGLRLRDIGVAVDQRERCRGFTGTGQFEHLLVIGRLREHGALCERDKDRGGERMFDERVFHGPYP